MVNRILQPQEIEVFYVLPAIRRELALSMKKAGKTQKDIAKLLGVTEPAVSQYISLKRAKQVVFDDGIKQIIHTAASRITDELGLFREMQKLMRVMHENRVICKVHESLGQAPSGCRACYETGH